MIQENPQCHNKKIKKKSFGANWYEIWHKCQTNQDLYPDVISISQDNWYVGTK